MEETSTDQVQETSTLQSEEIKDNACSNKNDNSNA